MRLPLAFLFFFVPIRACELHKPWDFLDCYTKETSYIGWIYGIMTGLVFISSVIALQMYPRLDFAWKRYTDDLPEYPNPRVNLPQNIVFPEPPRPPSVVSYFKLTGGDD